MNHFWKGFEKQAYISISGKAGTLGAIAGGAIGATAASRGVKPNEKGQIQKHEANRITSGTLAGMGIGSVAGHYLKHKTFKNVRL